MKKLLTLIVFLSFFILAGCDGEEPQLECTPPQVEVEGECVDPVVEEETEANIIITDSELNSFEVSILVENSTSSDLTAVLLDENNIIQKGYEVVLTEGSNTAVYNNLVHNGTYTVVVYQDGEELATEDVMVGSVIFTGISKGDDIATGLGQIGNITYEIQDPIGVDPNEVNTQYIEVNFDNPGNYEITQITFDGVTYTSDDFGPDSTNEKVYIAQEASDEPVVEVKRLNNYTFAISDDEITLYPGDFNIVEIATVKDMPEVDRIEAVVPIANKRGEATIAVYLDENEDEVEFTAITVNGVRYDEFDEEYSDEDVYMFVVEIEGSSGTETLNVESIEFDNLGGNQEYDLNGLTTQFDIEIIDLGKGTRTSPIVLDSIEDLVRMGQSPVWSRKGAIYELDHDLDFDNVPFMNLKKVSL